MTEPSRTHHVVIIGGGIAGLATAWALQQERDAEGLSLSYTLLEATTRWGGSIRSDIVEGPGDRPFVVEGGPDSFITQKPWGLELSRALGLEDRLIGTNQAMRKVFVLNRGKPTPMPDGVMMIVPTRLMPFALSPLISPLGKLRMGMDLFIPARRDGGDETLAQFIRRRLGDEALDKIAEPLMSGIYNAEADRQSLLATFPRFRALEEKYGSLTRGVLASRKPNGNGSGPGKNAPGSPAAKDGAGKPPLTMFASFEGGTAEIVDTLLGRLDGDLRLGARAVDIQHSGRGYAISLDGGEVLEADAVILASPAFDTADLIRDVAPEASAGLAGIRYVSTGTISLAYRLADLRRPLGGYGLVVPRSERRPINAITWSSAKFARRAPDGYALLRCFFGGSRSPQSMALDDDALLAAVRAELKAIMGVEAEPIFHRIYRWDRSNAQYDVGHLERVAAIETALPHGIHLTGSPYRGVGLPDCIHQAQQAVKQAIAGLA